MHVKEKINILMADYNTLRNEIFGRSQQRFALLILSGGVVAFGIFRISALHIRHLVALAAALALLLAVWMQLGRVMVRCSKRIAEIVY